MKILQFNEGNLPVRYFGLPLIPDKHSSKDCWPLLDKILARISTWSSRNFCGEVEAKAGGGIRVSWEKVCLPKREGGHGLKRNVDWNKAAVLKLIWNLFTQNGS